MNRWASFPWPWSISKNFLQDITIGKLSASALSHSQVVFNDLMTKERFFSPVISHNLACKAIAAGACNFAPDTENDATSDKLLSSVTDAVILLTSSSSVKIE